MFRLRPNQYRSLRDPLLAPSLARLAAELRTSLPDLVASFSDQQLKSFCDVGAVRARPYGITTEYNIYRFLCGMLFFGANFDTNQNLTWTREFLFNPLLEEDHKARLIELRIAIDKGRGI